MFAVIKEDIHIIERLLKHPEIDVNIKDNKGLGLQTLIGSESFYRLLKYRRE